MIIITTIIVMAIWWFGMRESEEEGVFCTMDAKLCPDGSYVGRIPPDCEFAPCPEVKTGILKGIVAIGPLCPVEPCPATTPNPYLSRFLILEKEGDGLFPPVSLNEDGTFETELSTGRYILNLSNCDFLGCSFSLPKTVLVEENKINEVNIDIDTGIR